MVKNLKNAQLEVNALDQKIGCYSEAENLHHSEDHHSLKYKRF